MLLLKITEKIKKDLLLQYHSNPEVASTQFYREELHLSGCIGNRGNHLHMSRYVPAGIKLHHQGTQNVL